MALLVLLDCADRWACGKCGTTYMYTEAEKAKAAAERKNAAPKAAKADAGGGKAAAGGKKKKKVGFLR